MTVTYEEFATYLMTHGVYEYRNNQTVHCYVTEEGKVRFFANWAGEETRDYASIKVLMERTTGRDLPSADDLMDIPEILESEGAAMLNALEDMANLFGNHCEIDAVRKARAVIDAVTTAASKRGG
jgi:hypothetical protein